MTGRMVLRTCYRAGVERSTRDLPYWNVLKCVYSLWRKARAVVSMSKLNRKERKESRNETEQWIIRKMLITCPWKPHPQVKTFVFCLKLTSRVLHVGIENRLTSRLTVRAAEWSEPPTTWMTKQRMSWLIGVGVNLSYSKSTCESAFKKCTVMVRLPCDLHGLACRHSPFPKWILCHRLVETLRKEGRITGAYCAYQKHTWSDATRRQPKASTPNVLEGLRYDDGSVMQRADLGYDLFVKSFH